MYIFSIRTESVLTEQALENEKSIEQLEEAVLAAAEADGSMSEAQVEMVIFHENERREAARALEEAKSKADSEQQR